jgi:hypothetical protein
LVGDRWATLARRAVTRGLLDYSRFDLSSRRHRQREKSILDELEAEENLELNRLLVLKLSPDIRDADARKDCGAAFRRVVQGTFPWLKAASGKVTVEEVKQFKGFWESSFGKLDSPEVQAALQKIANKPKKAKPQPLPKLKPKLKNERRQ